MRIEEAVLAERVRHACINMLAIMLTMLTSLARVFSLRHSFAWLLICGTLCAIGSAAHAMPTVRLDDGVGVVVLADKFEAFVDSGAQLTLADVQSPTHAFRFVATENDQIWAQAHEAIWLRIAFHNTAAGPRHWWLDTGSFVDRSMDLYAPDATGAYQRQSASSMSPFFERPLPLKTIAFPLHLQSGTDAVVYIRAKVASGLIINPKIWEPQALQHKLGTERNHWLVYLGAAGALVLFNLLLGIVLRDRLYALYALSCMTVTWSVSSFFGGFGAAFELLWPNWPAFQRFSVDSATVAAIVTGAIFIASLLDLRHQTPRLFKALVATTGLLLICWIVMHTVGPLRFNPGLASSMVGNIAPFYVLAAALTVLLLLISIVRLAWRGSRPARFLVLAGMPVGIVGLAMSLLQALYPLSNELMMWASLFEMLTMALALADRFQQDRAEKLRAQAALLAGLQASERAMEGKVVMRTQELSEALAQQQIAVAQNVYLVAQLTVQKNVAEAATLAKSRFLAAASHDLRQPTHALGLFIATLQSMAQRPDIKATDVEHIAGRLQTALSGLGRLLNGLLDVSRLDAGAVEVRKQVVSLDSELTNINNAFSGPANAKGLNFKVRLPAALSVDTDPVLLHQVLSNLAANAVRYTQHGRILIGCRRRADEVEIQVWDTGIGIAQDQHEKIFEEFYQIGNVARDHEQGLGLGLAIVQRSAGLLGTRLKLNSTLGKGSVFSFTLPRVDVTSAAQHREPTRSHAGRRSATVIVIDDDPDVLDAVRILLSNWGHLVIAANTLEQAVEAAGKQMQEIDLILSDYRLAENVNGADAIRAVLARVGRAIPAVIITGDTSPERIREASASGFRLLHKPLDPQALNALMEEYDV
ncbi:signal transduction histidine kinase [Undibacterium sp. GrIS 1.2]|uniref:hybrid sensor histidine kinase/response regulator n=1 Tax=Undibacterium sp. GrIS 1.2 TaxID=3143933 RepID=UPI003390B6A8